MSKSSYRYLLPLSLILLFLFPTLIFAKVGVGVGSGKIQVEKPLQPGMIHQLPPLTVFNTGDEPGLYSAGVEYHENQKQRRPPQDWFTFKPKEFELDPKESQIVKITLTLPLKAKPGEYFAYLEGFPIQKTTSGQTNIGVAAAAKLYFSIAPANVFIGIYYRLLTFWKNNLPWTNIAAIVTIFSILVVVFRQHFDLQLRVAKKDTPDKQKDQTTNE